MLTQAGRRRRTPLTEQNLDEARAAPPFANPSGNIPKSVLGTLFQLDLPVGCGLVRVPCQGGFGRPELGVTFAGDAYKDKSGSSLASGSGRAPQARR